MAPKRKRAASSATKPVEDNGATVPAVEVTGEDIEASPARSKKITMDPPTKRTRANSKRSTNGSSSTEQPTQMAVQTGGSVSMPINATEDGSGESGEAGTMRMAAPPQAGLVDPAGGFKTNPPPTGRPVRVYADGVFDLFHLGHMRVLQQAKTAFPDTRLIVGVTGDEETFKRKGLTVMSAKERAESVRHCRWVDEVIEDCPWIIDVPFLEKHNIDYVAHDDLPYGASEGDDIYTPIKAKGMFLVTQRTEGVSTTGIITKIVRDYEQYISRQLKRGTTRQELNISWLKKNEMDLKRHVSDLRDSVRQNWSTTGKELSQELGKLWQPSRPSSPAPSTTPSLRNGRGISTNGVDSPLPGSAPDRLRVETAGGRSSTPTRSKNLDFAAGYAMGLIGGVKGWMEGSKRRNLSDSRAQSPNDSPERSPTEDEEAVTRGRHGRTPLFEKKDPMDVVHA
ncbi:Putative Cytidyltransferase-like domain, rossmann-like alpha/beta/alpha sandwich [Septoria linicola]|uniref:choline-phosphate cytidylyltransferase n=1 Tax=Septoria linicola TaxID=215465 RepID=A0A9Q9EQI8_9PEZI|nr:putative Cytidyltransferase-like domain, rossmann-like alpha/beta/alpha sandwich [Septoria linicola]USW58814.1 Putative Cytidyltransferase-like domain, rossmann-like alpha/beta/alpha sandwich [Septoria linicola]